jgi:hypothetical protein
MYVTMVPVKATKKEKARIIEIVREKVDGREL